MNTKFLSTPSLSTFIKVLSLSAASLLAAPSFADMASDLSHLQQAWAEANYNLSGDNKTKALAELTTQADQAIAANPDSAEIYTWAGIIKSTYAGAKGGMGALSIAKASKADLEKALNLNDQALQGSAYTSLGVLYSKVPGWPIGFGDDDKAKALLQKALAINPDGIDPNYFYGEYLLENRDYKQALVYLEKAQQAPAREGRALADQGRQQEIAALLSKVNKKLKRH